MTDAEQRMPRALRACFRAKFRLTPIRQKIRAFLTTQSIPVSLDVVVQADDIRERVIFRRSIVV